MSINASKWKWFGSARHLCVRVHCRFHLCTQVGKYLISTVGEYWPLHEISNGTSECMSEYLKKNPLGHELGYGRFFETMVWEAGKLCACGCEMPDLAGDELDFAGYKDRKSATEGHLAMCKKWSKKK